MSNVMVTQGYVDAAHALERQAWRGETLLLKLWLAFLDNDVTLDGDLLAGLEQYRDEYGRDWPEFLDDEEDVEDE